MDLMELLKQRQSCRSFDPNKKISREDLIKILSAGIISPSAKNRQPWKFIVADNNATRDKVALACQEHGANPYLTNAPVLITVIKQEVEAIPSPVEFVKRQDYRPLDIGLAVGQMCLSAKSMGIDSLIVGWINDVKLIEALDLAPDTDIAVVVALGYASQGYPLRDKERRAFDTVVEFK